MRKILISLIILILAFYAAITIVEFQDSFSNALVVGVEVPAAQRRFSVVGYVPKGTKVIMRGDKQWVVIE